MKLKRKIIEIDDELCNGCGECIISCAEGALEIVDGKARMIAEKLCDGLGACLGECPTGALQIIERDADDFDEKAVEEHLATMKQQEQDAPACGCPSKQVQQFQVATPFPTTNKPRFAEPKEPTGSELSHWPVQIRLVPPSAPFLKNADLLVAADCTAFAYPAFHQDLLKGRVVMVGCPKFDEIEAYIHKFEEIFRTAAIRSITVAIMEVPCCSGMRMIISEALKRSGMNIETEYVVISARGEKLQKE